MLVTRLAIFTLTGVWLLGDSDYFSFVTSDFILRNNDSFCVIECLENSLHLTIFDLPSINHIISL